MKDKINTLFDCIKNVCDSDLERIINFVMGIVSVNQNLADRPQCPYCQGSKVIKYGHANGKQRFYCHECGKTYLHSTGTLTANSHFSRSIWADFIHDTLVGASLDFSAEKFGFSHQTAFNMRHKVLMALQDMLEKEPVLLSGIAELDETFVLDCYKGKTVPSETNRNAHKHGATVAKRGISNEYIAICTGIQRDGKAIAETVNRAKSSGKELYEIFGTYICEETLIFTDGLRSYNSLGAATGCTVMDVNHEENKKLFRYELLRSLNTIMYPHKDDFMDTVSEYIDFSDNEALHKEVIHVSTIEQIKYEGMREEGREEGRTEGIQALILDNLEEKIAKERILVKLQKYFDLTEEKAKQYYERFASGRVV